MRLNKKGFSLVELLIAVVVLGVFVAVFVPSLMNSIFTSKDKMDAAAVSKLETPIQMVLQHNSMYKKTEEFVDKTAMNRELVFVYTVDSNNTVVLDRCEMIKKEDGSKVTSKGSGEVAAKLLEIKEKVESFVNSNMKPIVLQSIEYREYEYQVKVKFTDIDFKVNAELEIIQ